MVLSIMNRHLLNVVAIAVILLFSSGCAFYHGETSSTRLLIACRRGIQGTRMVYESGPDLKSLVQKSEMIIAVSTTAVLASQIGDLRKALPNSCETSVIPATKLIPAIDGTAFCQLGQIAGVYFVAFVKKDSAAVYESFTKWARQVSRDFDEDKSVSNDNDEREDPYLFVCRKGYMLAFRKAEMKYL
jgi:Ribosomal protein L10